MLTYLLYFSYLFLFLHSINSLLYIQIAALRSENIFCYLSYLFVYISYLVNPFLLVSFPICQY